MAEERQTLFHPQKGQTPPQPLGRLRIFKASCTWKWYLWKARRELGSPYHEQTVHNAHQLLGWDDWIRGQGQHKGCHSLQLHQHFWNSLERRRWSRDLTAAYKRGSWRKLIQRCSAKEQAQCQGAMRGEKKIAVRLDKHWIWVTRATHCEIPMLGDVHGSTRQNPDDIATGYIPDYEYSL